MAEISYDGHSFIVNGRRVWLVSGSVHYARVPQPLWRRRIRAAKQAGLNCIDTYVFWNLHETKPGKFNFEGDRDLRQFVQTVGEEGMYCVVRPGPYIGSAWDFGGLPAWLHRVDGVKLRQSNGPFLEATARYLGAVMEQISDLQAITDGPILLMAAENRWFCDNSEQAQTYLLEVCRYLRENGCAVPIIGCNNMWSTVESIIGCWSGNRHLAADLRQLRMVQPHAPRIVIEYDTGCRDHWGAKHAPSTDAQTYARHLASILAVGGQYNISPFHGGTNFGFLGGRSSVNRSAFTTTSHDSDAPLTEAGGRGAKYLATKRISVFASQFSQLFAHLSSDPQHAAIAPTQEHRGISVIHQSGSLGHVVFLFKGRKEPATQTELLLPNGLTLPVPLGQDPVAWVAIEADLGGVAKLDFTNLRPWAFLNQQALVLFGPEGAEGLVCINGAMLHVTVPNGKTPVIKQHENITIIVLNTQQVDAAYVTPNGLVIGAEGLDDHDQPIAMKGWARAIAINPNGKIKRQAIAPIKRSIAPRLTRWQQARIDDLVKGTSDQFEPLDGPTPLEEKGCDFGYGWYRLSLGEDAKGKMLTTDAADRLAVYQKGKLTAMLGHGPAAVNSPTHMRLTGQMVVLADNLGRLADGWGMGEKKGLIDHLYTVRPKMLGRLKVVTGKAPDLFDLGGYFPFAHKGHQPVSDALEWKIQSMGKLPLLIELDRLPWRAVVMVNDQPVGAYDPELSGGWARFILRVGDQIHAKTNQLRLALYGQDDSRPLNNKFLSKHVRLFQATAITTANASWAFAPWRPPSHEQFRKLGQSRTPRPSWYRCQFNLSRTDTPLWFEPIGMTKGQVFINGRNAGRYFVNTHTGQSVEPQTRYYLPEPWLRTHAANELLVFDEHGKNPQKCRLMHDCMGPYDDSVRSG